MGLGNVVKKVFKGVKKVFKKILKPFAKILNNKWVKGIMVALSVVGGITAFIGAMSNGFVAGMKTIGSNLMEKITSVGKFIKALPSKIGTQAGKVKDFFLGNGPAATIEGGKGAAATIDATANTGELAKATIREGVSAGGEVVDHSNALGAQGAAKEAINSTASSVLNEGAKPGILRQGFDKAKGTLEWAEEHPFGAKVATDMIAAATAPDDPGAEYLKWQKKKYNERNDFFADFAPDIDVRRPQLEDTNQQNYQDTRGRGLLSRRRMSNLQPSQYAYGGR